MLKIGEKEKDEKIVPDNVSPVRYMIDEAFSLNTKFLKNYEEASTTKNAVVILEGDWGGQVYLVCPMIYVKYGKDILELLLKDLDRIAWKCNDGEGTGIYFEVRTTGEGISGGMGGGIAEEGLWVHEEFKEKGLEEKIRQVISGKIVRN